MEDIKNTNIETTDLLERLKGVEERARAAQARRQNQGQGNTSKVPKISRKAPIVKLPTEFKEHQAAPNICLRSALFGVVKKGRRRFLEDEVIASQDGYQVAYSGERLDQIDLNVWLAVKHLCSPHPLGTEVYFSAPMLFALLRKSDGQANRELIKRSLRRMSKGYVEMDQSGKRGFGGHLIDWWAWDEKAYVFRVILSPKMAPLFGRDCYTLLDIEQRQKLSRELSLWLHCYWSSHEQIYPISVEVLHQLCGSEAKNMREFRRELRKSIDELICIGFLKEGAILNPKGQINASKTLTSKAIRRVLKKLKKPLE